MGKAKKSASYRHCCKCVCCSYLILILLACLVGAGLSVWLRFFGPVARLSRTVSLVQADSPQLLSDFPQLCHQVTGTLDNGLINANITLYLSPDSTDDVPFHYCTLRVNINSSCTLDVPLNFGYRLYVTTESNFSDDEHAKLTLTCAPRVWLYAVLSGGTFLLLTLCVSVCLCCCACLCCRRKHVVEEETNLFIYTPLLNSADRGPDTDQKEHSLIVGTVHTPDGVVPTLHPTEMSSSYKFSSFKPGTKQGGSIRRAHLTKQKQPSPKKSYATISDNYTFDTFKPNNTNDQ